MIASASVASIELARDLLESDVRYFEWGANVEDLDGASLAWMPGLQGMPAGCVVQLTDPIRIATRTPGGLDAWLGALERRLERLGCPRLRLYLQIRDDTAEETLACRGYASRIERGMVYTAPPPAAPSGIALHRIESEADWAAKAELHAACPVGADGYAVSATEWTILERRKAEAGTLEFFLLVMDGRVCGSIGFAPCTAIARLKNVIVHPAYRRQHVASRGLQLLCRLAADRGKRGLGAFVIVGEPHEDLYARCGFRPVTEQIEWVQSTEEAARPEDPAPEALPASL